MAIFVTCISSTAFAGSICGNILSVSVRNVVDAQNLSPDVEAQFTPLDHVQIASSAKLKMGHSHTEAIWEMASPTFTQLAKSTSILKELGLPNHIAVDLANLEVMGAYENAELSEVNLFVPFAELELYGDLNQKSKFTIGFLKLSGTIYLRVISGGEVPISAWIDNATKRYFAGVVYSLDKI